MAIYTRSTACKRWPSGGVRSSAGIFLPRPRRRAPHDAQAHRRLLPLLNLLLVVTVPSSSFPSRSRSVAPHAVGPRDLDRGDARFFFSGFHDRLDGGIRDARIRRRSLPAHRARTRVLRSRRPVRLDALVFIVTASSSSSSAGPDLRAAELPMPDLHRLAPRRLHRVSFSATLPRQPAPVAARPEPPRERRRRPRPDAALVRSASSS